MTYTPPQNDFVYLSGSDGYTAPSNDAVDLSGFGFEVTLSWSLSPTSTSNVDGQRVYRTAVSNPAFPGDYNKIASLGDSTTSFVDTVAAGTYTYVVTAFNSAGESSPTATTTVKASNNELASVSVDRDVVATVPGRQRTLTVTLPDIDTVTATPQRSRIVTTSPADTDSLTASLQQAQGFILTATPTDSDTVTATAARTRTVTASLTDDDTATTTTARQRTLGVGITEDQDLFTAVIAGSNVVISQVSDGDTVDAKPFRLRELTSIQPTDTDTISTETNRRRLVFHNGTRVKQITINGQPVRNIELNGLTVNEE